MTDQLPIPSQVPQIYANGVGLSYSKTDCSITFVCNGDLVVTAIMPYPTAKSLAEGLTKMLEAFEQRSKSTIPRLTEILPDEPTK